MARKENALQRKLRKARERAERAAYERGDIPPRMGKGAKGKARAEERRRTAQREYHEFLTRPAEQTARMKAGDIRAEVEALHDLAYGKFRALMEQGTPNAATVKYMNEFAGMNVPDMNINELRHTANALRNWLRRKDLYLERQKRAQEKTLARLRAEGLTVTAADLPDYWDFVNKAQHSSYYRKPEGSQGSPDKATKQAFARMMRGEITMQDALNEAEQGMKESYERTVKNNGFVASPLEYNAGVQPSQPSKLLAHFTEGMRLLAKQPTNRAQRRAEKRRKKRGNSSGFMQF